MVHSDRVEEFFDELGRRGHEPLLDRLNATGRFEVLGGERTDEWLVAVRGGYITVTRGGGDADYVLRGARHDFDRIIHGDAGSVAALVRGTMTLSGSNAHVRFGLITRLFAGAPDSRRVWVDDPRLVAEGQQDREGAAGGTHG